MSSKAGFHLRNFLKGGQSKTSRDLVGGSIKIGSQFNTIARERVTQHPNTWPMDHASYSELTLRLVCYMYLEESYLKESSTKILIDSGAIPVTA